MRCSYSSGLHEFLQDIVLVFVNLVESSTLKYNQAKILFQHLSNIDLNNELDMVNETSNFAKNLSQIIGNISREVSYYVVD